MSTCRVCSQPATKRCPCRIVHYCSERCQAQDWSRHLSTEHTQEAAAEVKRPRGSASYLERIAYAREHLGELRTRLDKARDYKQTAEERARNLHFQIQRLGSDIQKSERELKELEENPEAVLEIARAQEEAERKANEVPLWSLSMIRDRYEDHDWKGGEKKEYLFRSRDNAIREIIKMAREQTLPVFEYWAEQPLDKNDAKLYKMIRSDRYHTESPYSEDQIFEAVSKWFDEKSKLFVNLVEKDRQNIVQYILKRTTEAKLRQEASERVDAQVKNATS